MRKKKLSTYSVSNFVFKVSYSIQSKFNCTLVRIGWHVVAKLLEGN